MDKKTFNFKQFTVLQSDASMKISSEACILGAVVPVTSSHRVLDIGAGTGVLSLMLAQRTNANIDAIEIDRKNFDICKANFEQSKWYTRLTPIHHDIRTVSLSPKYDLIISNPPFFNKQLTSPSNRKNTARHCADLSLNELLYSVKQHISDFGYFYTLLPEWEEAAFCTEAKSVGLFPFYQMSIHHSPKGRLIRKIIGLSKLKSRPEETHSLFIRKEDGNYHEQFKALLQDYFIIF